MNRKQKIMLYSVLIFLVILLLLGFTYGYFMTKIIGNDNEKSISVTSGTLELTYGENTSEILGDAKVEPGYTVTKTFSATNTGDRDVIYGVVLENIENSFTRQEDIVYTLTCKSYKKDTTTISGTCDGKEETQFPATGDVSLMITNTIPVDITHSYELTITYKNLQINQSIDMGNKFSARVNIRDVDTLNPYISNTKALNYNIINNAIKASASSEANGTAIYRVFPTNKTNEVSLVLSQDDLGTTYYFRGAVKNNYVNLAGKCFRIVRIEGDGSIKLILEDNNATCNSGIYTGDWRISSLLYNSYSGSLSSFLSSSMVNTFKTWQSSLNSYINSGKLKNDEWCFDNYSSGTGTDYDCNGDEFTYTNYGSVNYTFKCLGTKYTKYSDNSLAYVSTLTDDEVSLAIGKSKSNYYFRNDTFDSHWFTTSISNMGSQIMYNLLWNENFGEIYGGTLPTGLTSWAYGDSNIRPVITLKNTVTVTGEGTKTNPYEIQ